MAAIVLTYDWTSRRTDWSCGPDAVAWQYAIDGLAQ